MQLVVGLSRTNVDEGTGGPFGAGVFDMVTGQLIRRAIGHDILDFCDRELVTLGANVVTRAVAAGQP